MNMRPFFRKTLMTLAVTALTSANVYAGTVAQTPLFLSTAAESNIILGLDDSGSMDFEVLAATNDGAYWWNETNRSFVGLDQNDQVASSDTFNFNKSGNASPPWDKYPYLFPFPKMQAPRDGGYNGGCGTDAHFFLPPTSTFAWARSPQYNHAYFNPTSTYSPWVKADGTAVYTGFDSAGDINPAAAPDDPYLYTSSTVDLTNVVQDTSHGFMLFQGMSLPVGTVVYNPNGNSGTGAWQTISGTPDPIPDSAYTGAIGFVSTCSGVTRQYLPIQYFPATFWIQANTAADAITAAGAGYSSFVSANLLTGQGPAGSSESMFGFEIKPANFSISSQYTAAIQSFANWFSYYRRRHLALRASLTQTFLNLSNTRVGCEYMNQNTTNGCTRPGGSVTMYDLNSSSAKASLFTNFLTNSGSGGTPTWNLLNYIGTQYQRTDSSAPITQACQKNFTLIFTDGYASYPYPSSSGISNLDASTSSPYGNYNFGSAPYSDNVSGTLADLATYYYANNLRPDLIKGLVTADTACGSPGASKALDCNTNLHMDTYAVSLASQGQIWNVDMNATNNPFTYTPAWPASSAYANRSPTGVDDLWHATIDGRGQMFAASTPQQIATQLQSVLSSIASRTSSASAIATNSTRLDTDTYIYQARFQTTDWTGSLRAFKVQSDGSVASTASWDAAQQIPIASSRYIATWNPTGGISSTGAGAPFQWSSLSTTQQTSLNINPVNGFTDNLGSDRVTWLRGGSVSSSDGFRTRSTELGDIINSNPLYVQDANFNYNAAPLTVNSVNVGQATYSSYFVGNLNRQGVIYVGANDGMFHAFNADTGKEIFAYVPSTAISSLNKLMSPSYAHQYYVDGTPTYGDAFLNGAWGTYLVGTMGAGGTGVFALNITNPASISSETTAASNVLWEVNSSKSGYSDMGYTLPRASIALMANGQYAAIVSNGFDSSTGMASIFIISLKDGSLIRELTTTGSTSSPNGMAAATPVDTNTDRVTDYIYAGDLQGDLWKFDVTSSNPASWCISNDKGGCGTTSTPLFQAQYPTGTGQPITVRPVVGLSQDGVPQIYFGTGKYFESTDNTVGSSPQVQSFYSVIDRSGGTILTRSALLQQQILSTTQVTMGTPPVTTTVRVTSNNPTSGSMTQPGWYMDLLPSTSGAAAGERMVSTPELDNGRIIFTTLIPNIDPCQFGGTSFLMELDAFTGSRLTGSPFDLNNDKNFNAGDYVTITNSDGTTSKVAVSGQQSTVGIIQTPAIISASSLEYKYFSGSTGTIGSVKESQSGNTGRQSWTQLQ